MSGEGVIAGVDGWVCGGELDCENVERGGAYDDRMFYGVGGCVSFRLKGL